MTTMIKETLFSGELKVERYCKKVLPQILSPVGILNP